MTGDEIERKAVGKGGQAAGAYLDQIGVFDMSKLTRDQWESFCLTLFRESAAEMQRIADDEIPF